MKRISSRPQWRYDKRREKFSGLDKEGLLQHHKRKSPVFWFLRDSSTSKVGYARDPTYPCNCMTLVNWTAIACNRKNEAPANGRPACKYRQSGTGSPISIQFKSRNRLHRKLLHCCHGADLLDLEFLRVGTITPHTTSRREPLPGILPRECYPSAD